MPVITYLGLREFARFHVDLVTDLIMTGPPDEVTPLVPVSIPGITSTTYRAYPIADHIADKVCAMIEIHNRADGQRNPRLADRDVTQALRTAAALLDPALTMTATGTWDPTRHSWSQH